MDYKVSFQYPKLYKGKKNLVCQSQAAKAPKVHIPHPNSPNQYIYLVFNEHKRITQRKMNKPKEYI